MSRLIHLSAMMIAAGVSHPAQLAPGIMNAENTTRVLNAWTPGNPAGIAGMGFNVNVYEQIVARAYDVKYPEIEWSKFIPSGSLDTSVSPGAKIASARVRDWRGKGAFRAVVGKNIPTVSISQNKISVPLEAGGVMAHADIDDIRSVAMGFEGMQLLTELGAAMRRGYELHREQVFFYGYAGLGFDGYLDTPTVSETTAGTKTAGGTTWAVGTPAEIVKDVTTAISTVITQTKGIFKPNRVVLPLAQWLQISVQNIGGTSGSLQNESILSYLLRTLPAMAGGPVEIVSLRYLNDVGVGSTPRMIVETTNPECFYMPDSVPFQMLPPQDRQFATELYADYKFGGLLRPQPRSALYMDGL